MAHPHHESHAEKREKAHDMIARTGHHLARGGHADAAEDAAMIRKAVHEHEAADHPGKPKTHIRFKAGGAVHGEAAHHHLGRRARGGHTGKGKQTHVNVIVAPQGGGMHPPMPAAAPAPPPPRPVAPPPPAAPRPAMAPPPGAGMMPPGGGMRPPGMMKRGGGVKKMVEAGTPSENLLQAKKGGHVRKRDVGGQTGMPMTGAAPQGQQGPTPQQIQAARQMMAQRAMQRTGAQMPGQTPQMPTQKRGGRTERKNGGGVDMEAGAGGGEGRIEKMHEYGHGGFKPKEHRGELVRARG